jgi:hypothetical protein
MIPGAGETSTPGVMSPKRITLLGCGKTLSESFDAAQDERRRIDFIGDLPFLLRHSKHSEPISSNPLEA